jgi:hypothetical protein
VASGYKATIPGGGENVAAGDYSFAAGNRAKIRSAHYGTFLFADKSTVNFNSAAPNEFAVRARGGVRFVLAINGSGSPTWSCNVVNGGSWSCSSDRNLKENFVELDTREVLKRLSGVPILQWNAKGVDPTIKHVGPMAQDFYAAFGLGDSDKVISTIDLDGVALASIQGLYEIAQAQDEQIAAQQEQIAALEARLATLEQAILGDAR